MLYGNKNAVMFQGSWRCRSFGSFCHAEGEGFVGTAVAVFGTNSAVPRSVGSYLGGLELRSDVDGNSSSGPKQVVVLVQRPSQARCLSLEVKLIRETY